jgi:hypothetical protein
MTERSADLWLTLNKMLLRLFRFDTASLCGFVSLPTLAFRCIWLKCAEKSGIFHQSIEKMKPFNEHMIREPVIPFGPLTHWSKSKPRALWS